MRKYRRLLYSFHHASTVPKHLHSGLSLLLYGESYDPGRIGIDFIGFVEQIPIRLENMALIPICRRIVR